MIVHAGKCKYVLADGSICGTDLPTHRRGFCDYHHDLACMSCTDTAIRDCPDVWRGDKVCGLPLCGSCEHAHGYARRIHLSRVENARRLRDDAVDRWVSNLMFYVENGCLPTKGHLECLKSKGVQDALKNWSKNHPGEN